MARRYGARGRRWLASGFGFVWGGFARRGRRGADLAAWAQWTADWAMETEFGEFGIWLSYPLQDCMGEMRVRNRMAASDGK